MYAACKPGFVHYWPLHGVRGTDSDSAMSENWLESQKSELGKPSQYSHVAAVIWAKLGNIETT